MRKEDKSQLIETLTGQLNEANCLYITDIGDLNSEVTSKLRGLSFKREVSLSVVKNSLLRKAMERSEKNFEELYDILKGNTAIMTAEVGNQPAKLIKEFRKSADRPILKGAYVEESCYIGDDQVEILSNIKSKEEVIADVIALLQSPVKNVLGALQSSGQTLSGVLKTLSERGE